MTDEATVVSFEFWVECAIRVDGGFFPLLIHEKVLPWFYIKAELMQVYEYLWGACENILLR